MGQVYLGIPVTMAVTILCVLGTGSLYGPFSYLVYRK